MNQSKISTRYAKAFYQLIKEKSLFDAINLDIELFHKTYNEIPEFVQYITSPTVNISGKKKFLNDLLADKMSSEFIAFLKLIIQNKREIFLVDILRNYQKLYKEHEGIKSVVITSARELSDSNKTNILTFVQKEFASKIDVVAKVNPDLIGGFILRVEDQQLDVSIATKLKKIKKQLNTASL